MKKPLYTVNDPVHVSTPDAQPTGSFEAVVEGVEWNHRLNRIEYAIIDQQGFRTDGWLEHELSPRSLEETQSTAAVERAQRHIRETDAVTVALADEYDRFADTPVDRVVLRSVVAAAMQPGGVLATQSQLAAQADEISNHFDDLIKLCAEHLKCDPSVSGIETALISWKRALLAIEQLTSDDFCEDAAMQTLQGRELKCVEKLTDIYYIAHAENANQCKHPDWKKIKDRVIEQRAKEEWCCPECGGVETYRAGLMTLCGNCDFVRGLISSEAEAPADKPKDWHCPQCGGVETMFDRNFGGMTTRCTECGRATTDPDPVIPGGWKIGMQCYFNCPNQTLHTITREIGTVWAYKQSTSQICIEREGALYWQAHVLEFGGISGVSPGVTTASGDC